MVAHGNPTRPSLRRPSPRLAISREAAGTAKPRRAANPCVTEFDVAIQTPNLRCEAFRRTAHRTRMKGFLSAPGDSHLDAEGWAGH
jgi:hypothetical protein